MITEPEPRGAVSAPTPPTGGETPPLRSDAISTPILKPTLGQIVAFYKYQTTKSINVKLANSGVPFWQRDFYDHIIRNEKELHTIQKYILENPLHWKTDQDNPNYSSNG
jgi:hypothetical protein